MASARATGETHYIVEPDGFTDPPTYRVTRINPIGQGWGVAAYATAAIATTVATTLTAYVGSEVR